MLTYRIIRGSLVRKLASHGRLSWLAVSPSRQPHHHLNHHVNHIVMSTTSSSSSWGEWAIGNARTHAWKHSQAWNLFVFSSKVAVRVRRWRVSVSAVARLDRGKRSTKCARDWWELRFTQRKAEGFGALLAFIHCNSFISMRSCQFIHSFAHSFIFSFIHSLIHSILLNFI